MFYLWYLTIGNISKMSIFSRNVVLFFLYFAICVFLLLIGVINIFYSSLYSVHCTVGRELSSKYSLDYRKELNLTHFTFFVAKCTHTLHCRVGHPFFSKERNVLGFFSILYKRMRRSLRSFLFFIKERGILCVLLLSV